MSAMPGVRPVSVRKWHGKWQVLDLGGGLRDWDGTPLGLWPVCCWDKAMSIARRLENQYRLKRPAYTVAPYTPHPPHTGVGRPCPKARVSS